MQNAFIESFNGRLRDELLNEKLFTSLPQACVTLGCWTRPHSQLAWKTPSEFAHTCNPRRGHCNAHSIGLFGRPALKVTVRRRPQDHRFSSLGVSL